MMRMKWLSAAALGVLGVAGSAQAQLITNGGFETGNFNGWTVNARFTTVEPANAFDAPRTGTYFASLAEFQTFGTLSQTFATTPGLQYDLQFYMRGTGTTNSEFEAIVNNVTLLDLADTSAAGGYQAYNYSFVPTTTTSTLTFRFRDDDYYISLDDVSVTAVPEPAALGLLGVGATAALRRRRR